MKLKSAINQFHPGNEFEDVVCKMWIFYSDMGVLTHRGRVTHICVNKLTIIGSDNYLNQCWNIAYWTLQNKLQWNLYRNSYISIQEYAFENVVCEMASILSGPQCVKSSLSIVFSLSDPSTPGKFFTAVLFIVVLAPDALIQQHIRTGFQNIWVI